MLLSAGHHTREETNPMTQAAAAAEHRSNAGHDFTLADAYDAEYVDDEPEPRDARRDEEAAPLMGVRHTKVERCGAFVI